MKPNATTERALMEAELLGAVAQLRHAYSHLAAEGVTKQREFADGLIAPQIRRLERLARVVGQSTPNKKDPAS